MRHKFLRFPYLYNSCLIFHISFSRLIRLEDIFFCAPLKINAHLASKAIDIKPNQCYKTLSSKMPWLIMLHTVKCTTFNGLAKTR